MIIDGELGMPLELGKIPAGSYGDGSYWTGNRSGASLPIAPNLLSSGQLMPYTNRNRTASRIGTTSARG